MNPSNQRTPFLLILAGGLIGSTLFLLLLGPSSLRVQNVDWLIVGDTGAHYLAWSFFRLEPWSFPLGRMSFYGTEMASNVVFADGIPLVALPLKVFSPFLPTDFQFFGWWAMACFVLQGMAAVWLLGKFSRRSELLLIGAAFFAMQPIMLYRFGWHFSLMAQWLIPLGLGLFFSPPHRRIWLAWLVLLVCAVAIHAYLLAMLLAIFSLWLAREVLLRFSEKSPRQAGASLLYAAGIGGVVCAVMASLDYFRPMMLHWGSAKNSGGGANLLGGVLPTVVEGFLLPTHEPAFDYQHEGFWYLGAGVLLLLICALLGWLFRRRAIPHSFLPMDHRWPGIVWGSFGLLLVVFFILSTALSLTFGKHVLLDLPIPERIQGALDVFRWVGRFIWPVASGLLFLALLGSCLLPRWQATMILALCLGLQFMDVNLFAKRELQWRQNPNRASAGLADPRWDELLSGQQGVSVIPYPFKRFESHEYDLGLLAYRHRVKIDASYYARYPEPAALDPMWQRFHDFWRGRPDPNWLYVIHEDLLKRKNLHAWKTLLPLEPRLLLLDHYYVASFAPESEKNPPPIEWPLASLSADWEIFQPGVQSFIDMGNEFDSLFLGGFEPNPQGAWLSHDLGVLAFRILEDAGSLQLKFVPSNPSNTHKFLVKAALISEGKIVTEEEIQPDLGWSEFTLRFEDIPKGDYVFRLEVQRFHQQSEQWVPRKGSSVILMEAELF
jgi:hypothetical protein